MYTSVVGQVIIVNKSFTANITFNWGRGDIKKGGYGTPL